MDWFVKAFVKASVAWLAVGVVLGMAMAMVPAWTVYRAMHVHVMLLGFVTMFINGVGYHVVPRLSGRPLWSIRAAHWHWWIANAGLCVMVRGILAARVGQPARHRRAERGRAHHRGRRARSSCFRCGAPWTRRRRCEPVRRSVPLHDGAGRSDRRRVRSARRATRGPAIPSARMRDHIV